MIDVTTVFINDWKMLLSMIISSMLSMYWLYMHSYKPNMRGIITAFSRQNIKRGERNVFTDCGIGHHKRGDLRQHHYVVSK